VTDFPAIMSAQMIRAILREVCEPGTGKTCTRRLAWTGRKAADGEGFRPSSWQRVKAGDRIWVRESIHVRPIASAMHAISYFDEENPAILGGWAKVRLLPWDHQIKRPEKAKWIPSIHMPRAVSRLTLHVTSTKIERLQDITEADALAEGIRETAFHREDHPASICFSALWDSLHGADSWNANPFVVAVSFRPVLANIDSLEIAA
jgi:hypothetical protein